MQVEALARRLLIVPLGLCAVMAGGAIRRGADTCGPFTDVSPLYCPFVLELYYLGITAGTSATTFSTDLPITRGQAAVFVAAGINQSLARSSRRAALGQWWTSQNSQALAYTIGDAAPFYIQSDGVDLWVSNLGSSTVSRVRASDGRVLETWTGATGAAGLLVAMGRIFVTDLGGVLHMIDPSQPPGSVTTVATGLGMRPEQVAFDGARIWTANLGNAGDPPAGSISIITPGTSLPWSVTNVAVGPPETSSPGGVIFDGQSVWVTDVPNTLLKLDTDGAVLQTVTVGFNPGFPVFDGENIWVPTLGPDAVVVVKASSGMVIANLTGNGLRTPRFAAFDGQRILVTNLDGGSVSVWNASTLEPIGSLFIGAAAVPFGACSDGVNFWITLHTSGQIVRFGG